MSDTFHEFCVSQVRRLSATIFQTGVDPQSALSEIRHQIETQLSRGEREFVERLVNQCLSVSKHCPTVADLYAVSGALRDQERQRKQENDHEARRACPQGRCDGSGWRQVYHLRTKKGLNEFSYWESEFISRDQFDDLGTKVDWITQGVYEARCRCKCNPASQERIDKAGKYA